jgi:CO/xanthine dehydrogenase FAD-binding subunit
MMRFDYADPRTLHEARALLMQHGARACLMAGGTDLLVEIKEHIRQPALVVDLKRIAGLDRLDIAANGDLHFGALVTARQLETHALVQRCWPGLHQAVVELGSIQVRHRATVVGNICRASPSADTLPPLIADGARLRVQGAGGERDIALEDFFTGAGRTVLQAGDIVLGVVVPAPAARSGRAYIKHGRRKAMELATVGVAVALEWDEEGRCGLVRIALGAVAATPLRARSAEDSLRGQRISESALACAAERAMAEARPISNVRASAAYRREMVGVLTRRALAMAVHQGGGTVFAGNG